MPYTIRPIGRHRTYLVCVWIIIFGVWLHRILLAFAKSLDSRRLPNRYKYNIIPQYSSRVYPSLNIMLKATLENFILRIQ